MADDLARLGMALAIIMLISACLYQIGGRSAVAVEPPAQALGLK